MAAKTGSHDDARSFDISDLPRIIGGFVVVALACAALSFVAPLMAYGATIFAGILAGALSERPSLVVAPAQAGLAALVAAALAAAPPSQAYAFDFGEYVLIVVLAVLPALLVFWLRSIGLRRDFIAWVLLAAIMLTFAVEAGQPLKQWGPGALAEPPAEQYAFDPVMFSKTFYLMERGEGFYQAYSDAFIQDSRFDAPTRDLAGWRSPTTFWLWTLFAGQWSTVVYAFILLSLLAMGAGYFVAWKAFHDPVGAVLPAALMMPYYLFALTRWWYPELEFWAAFVALGSAVAIYLNRERLAIGLALLAGLMREWLLSALFAGGLQRLITRKARWVFYWGIAAALAVGSYVLNSYFVRKYLLSIGIQPQLGTGGRVGGGGPGFILYTARFCCDMMANPYVVPWVTLGVAIVVALVMAIRSRNVYLPGLLLIPLAGFMIFGSGRGPFEVTGWNDYYGAAYLPFAFILAAGILDITAIPKAKSAKAGDKKESAKVAKKDPVKASKKG